MLGMWIRLRLDIGWNDLLAAASYCVWRAPDAYETTARTWTDGGDAIVTLSLRSGFDLLLRALELPVGSVVLMSALTIPDMETIVRVHGLVPRGIDVDGQGRICIDSLRRAMNDNVRLVVVAHLFGGHCDMDQVAGTLQSRDVVLVEDCAQSFSRVGEVGHPRSDVVLHSFGAIKTATALGGGLASVKSAVLRSRMQSIQNLDPRQRTSSFARRLIRFTLLKFVSGRLAARWLWLFLRVFSTNADRTINNVCRSFRGTSLLSQLRRRPCAAQLQLLTRRWLTYDFGRVSRRIAMGRQMDAALGTSRNDGDTYWVYPLYVDDPETMANQLRARGFDATHGTRMSVVTPDRCPRATAMLERVVFIPWYAELNDDAIDEMAKVLSELLNGGDS